MRRGERPAERLRRAVDCLPERTRRAMLDAVREERIVVGAYTHDGGVCPMLAAHRRGGRTGLASFARAWDRYATATKPRPASERELRTLRSMLEASLAADAALAAGPGGELGAAIRDHQRALRSRFEREARAGGGSWAWLRRLGRQAPPVEAAADREERDPTAVS